MKTSIKKILCVALVIMMAIPVVAINTGAADATYKSYADAQNGDLLYNVNFNGTAGLFAPADGVGKWNKTGATVSPDGSALTFGFTKEWTEEPDDGDGTWGRARFSVSLKNYTTVGTSYTIQFTLDSAAPVGVVLDGGGGFVINPAANTVSVGRYGSWSKIAKAQTYAGPASNKQTYAIELAFPSTTMTNYNNIESYCPEVYRLYVLDETTSKWQLIREIDVSLSIQFDWEAAYSYLDFAVIRYSDKYQINADGDYILSTLSDVSLYKGIGILNVEEVTPPADNSGNDDNTGNTGNTDNTGNTTTDDQTEKKPVETYAPPKSVTEAATEADTEDTAEKNGCGSSLAFAGLAVVGACTAVVAVKRRKNKED